MTVEVFRAKTDGRSMRIGVVQARFNDKVCNALREACIRNLLAHQVAEADIVVATVPGALEVPLALAQMAQSGQFDALIALGAVIRGETYHFEVVSNESAAGIMRVGLDYSIPIANAILTTNNDAQAEARALEKGAEAALVAIEMANLVASIRAMAQEESE